MAAEVRSASLVATPTRQRTEAVGGRLRIAHRSMATSQQRFTGGDTGEAPHRGSLRTGRTPRSAWRSQRRTAPGGDTEGTLRDNGSTRQRARRRWWQHLPTHGSGRVWSIQVLFRGRRIWQPEGTTGDGHRRLLSSFAPLGLGRAGSCEVPSIFRDIAHIRGFVADGNIGGDHSVKPVGSYQGLHGNEWWRTSGVVL